MIELCIKEKTIKGKPISYLSYLLLSLISKLNCDFMVENRELQEKILTYRVLEGRLGSLLKQRDLIASKLVEIQNTIQSISEIESGEEILFPLGSGIHAFGKIEEKGKVMIEIGGGIVLEKTVEEGMKMLKERRGEIENSLKATQGNIGEMSSKLEQLGTDIQELGQGLERTTEAG